MADKVLKEKRRLFVRSVGAGTMNGLLDALLEKKVLSQEEMEKVRDENPTVMDKARALMDAVIRKGPRACQVCVNHICEDDAHLADVLQLLPGPQAVQDNPVRFASSGPEGSLKLCPAETAEKIWNEKSAEIYPIMERSVRTRLALIICNTEFDSLPRRDGAHVDIRDMKTLLEGLGYSVDVKENLTALCVFIGFQGAMIMNRMVQTQWYGLFQDMRKELKVFAARPEHRTSDSTFLVLMSHGIRSGICGKKYSEEVPDVLDVNTIFQTLNTMNCPSLKDKPKVIIIQACRGDREGVVWLKDSAEASGQSNLLDPKDFEEDAIKKAHVEKDFIAFCSSTPDNVSWRHPMLGSLFIIKLIKILQEHAWSCDLEEIFRKDIKIRKLHQRLWADVCDEVEIYPIKERKDRTRLALIICNTEFEHLPVRDGAALDITGMKGLLEGLGYSVDVEERLTAKDMESVLRRFAARPEHKSSDSMFLVLMSHGILDGICGKTHSDEKPDVLPYDTIFRIFNNRNCLSLKDKPKVIIVQACRGANRGELWVSDAPPARLADSSSEPPDNLEEDAVYKTHVEKDFIAFCSSTPRTCVSQLLTVICGSEATPA
ncbi:caspase-1 isoform 1 [Camelus ferus]|nr:caspase-1 isoform 1 [Camelus ferus]